MAGCCPPQGRELLLMTAVTTRNARKGCCPPQGRELLLEKAAAESQAQQVAVPRRGTSCYPNVKLCCRTTLCYCPPQGRELLRSHHRMQSIR